MPRTRLITAWGETKRLFEWVQDHRCNLSEGAVRRRLENGLPAEEALWSNSRETLDDRKMEAKIAAEFSEALKKRKHAFVYLIQNRRAAAGISQAAAAEAAGISRIHWTRIETGASRPKPKTSIRMATAVGVELPELIHILGGRIADDGQVTWQ